MAYNDQTEYPRGVVHYNLGTTPRVLAATGTPFRVAWITVYNGAGATVEIRLTDGANNSIASYYPAAEESITIPLGAKFNGFKVAAPAGATADKGFTVVYYDD
jgi:hypothetical protein